MTTTRTAWLFAPITCSLVAASALMAQPPADEPAAAQVSPSGEVVDGADPSTADSANVAETPAPRVSAARPPMTAEQRSEWAARLREIYAQSPDKWPTPAVDSSVKWRELGLLPDAPDFADDPQGKELVELGRLLFFDPRLSGSGQMACSSCHDPELGWTDGRSTALGNRRKPLARNTPSVFNTASGKSMFWDGRAVDLEDQARKVLLNPDEMDSSEAILVERLGAIDEYNRRFTISFGDAEVSLDRVAEALAAFERTLVGGRSRLDAFLRGNRDALDDEAVIGLHLFRTDARCLNCHNGPDLSDHEFHNVGLSYYGRSLEDLGRYNVTFDPADVGKFRTPSLRNLPNTRPYMHNGLFELEGVLNMYNAGMPTLRRKPHQALDPLFPTKSPLLEPLRFNRQDLAALGAFLESLGEPRLRVRPPALPEFAGEATASAGN